MDVWGEVAAEPVDEAATHGWNLPRVCTPLELMGEWTSESDHESNS